MVSSKISKPWYVFIQVNYVAMHMLQLLPFQLIIIFFQVHDLEFAQIEMKVVEGLKLGNESLKKMHEVLKFIPLLNILIRDWSKDELCLFYCLPLVWQLIDRERAFHVSGSFY